MPAGVKWSISIIALSILFFCLLPLDQTLLFIYALLFSFYPARELRQWVSTLSRKARNVLGIGGLAAAGAAVYAVYVLSSRAEGDTVGFYYALLTIALTGGTLGSLLIRDLATWLKKRSVNI
ncbi:MAG: hypothetical protein NUW06_00005 [Candidatus Acetothermia bacterium]|jgi:hypothetical protein|nr:hypothetical protein [Candidatus Acetothermia bacterium]MDH7504896.1 hypothetical protein [Candidatus Acetothermia bacterium]